MGGLDRLGLSLCVSSPITSVLQFLALVVIHSDSRWEGPLVLFLSIVSVSCISFFIVMLISRVVEKKNHGKNIFRHRANEFHAELGRVVGLLIGLFIGTLAFRWAVGV